MAYPESPSFLASPLTSKQLLLLQVIYDGCKQKGRWPIWQYADLTLDQQGINAAEVLASLPRLGDTRPGMHSYGLASATHGALQSGATVWLTVAGLWFVPEASILLDAFVKTLSLMVDIERTIIPDPEVEVRATLNSKAVKRRLTEISNTNKSEPPLDITIAAVGSLLASEPFAAWSGLSTQQDGNWNLTLSTGLGGVRALRGIQSAKDYVEKVIERLTPESTLSVPHSIGTLDLPYACDYLDTVWKVKTGSRLFNGIRVGSSARLALNCESEEEFNSLMSALADVFAAVVAPGKKMPPRNGALFELKKNLNQLPSALTPEGSARVEAAIDRLITVIQVRHGQQHGDAADKAMKAYRDLGIAYPPYDWAAVWTQILTIAQGAVDAIREEIQAGLSDA